MKDAKGHGSDPRGGRNRRGGGNYTYVQTLRTDRGTKWMLRREDGSRVTVSRKRFNELVDQKRVKTSAPPAHQTGVSEATEGAK